MKRRSFISHAVSLSASTLAMPYFLTAGKKNQEFIIGHNDHTYRVDTGWGDLSGKAPVKDCHEMVQDGNGRLIMITNETRNNIIIYDRSGKLVNTWGHEFPGGHGLTLARENDEEFLFITDYEKHQVYKTTLDGRILLTLDVPVETGKYDSPESYKPTEVAVAPNGDFYVADGYGAQYIIHYDPQGRIKNIFGGRGEGEANFENCHGICYDHRDPDQPMLLVTARVQNAFKRFTPEGEYIDTIPLPGAYVCRPVIKGEYLYFSVLISRLPWDSKSGFVMVLDRNNKVVSVPGGSNPVYTDDLPEPFHQVVEVFKHPHDVCIDNDENIYVPQWNSGNTYPIRLERV